jgi:hypothetical protein
LLLTIHYQRRNFVCGISSVFICGYTCCIHRILLLWMREMVISSYAAA